jgi:hypothetical protein
MMLFDKKEKSSFGKGLSMFSMANVIEFGRKIINFHIVSSDELVLHAIITHHAKSRLASSHRSAAASYQKLPWTPA